MHIASGVWEGVQLLAVCLRHDSACGTPFIGAPARTGHHLRNEGILLAHRGAEGTTQIVMEVLADQSWAEDWAA